ncbi:MAG: hypothetical protein ACLU3I_17705 [Acutalibacteraceae bacterium]
MAKAKVDRNTDYLLRMRIRGEMSAQHVSIEQRPAPMRWSVRRRFTG